MNQLQTEGEQTLLRLPSLPNLVHDGGTPCTPRSLHNAERPNPLVSLSTSLSARYWPALPIAYHSRYAVRFWLPAWCSFLMS